jgi:colanic acid biosynthesis glycosyl transferase WcaI
MNVVLLNQFFWPDTVATSQILTEAARSLGQEHDVTVICGGGSAKNPSFGETLKPSVKLIRIRNSGFGHSALARVASYLTYFAGVIWHACLMRRPDCFITLTTPPVLSVVGTFFAQTKRTKHLIWEMDVYPDIATDIGYFKRGSIVERFSGAILDWSRRRADAIIVLGEDMKERLIARGIAEAKIHVAENWADGAEITPLSFPQGPLVVHYSGNLGLAHESATISAVIGRLANQPNFRFIFAGGGPRRPELEAYCRERSIKNVEFRSYCSNAELGQSLAEGDLGLVTQIPETLGSIVPSKIYGIMAAGRPLLYIGPDGSTPSRHIQSFDCGWRIQPGDVDGAIHLLLHLNANRHLLRESGSRGRAAFEQHFDRPIGVARILAIVLDSGVKVAHA